MGNKALYDMGHEMDGFMLYDWVWRCWICVYKAFGTGLRIMRHGMVSIYRSERRIRSWDRWGRISGLH
jgi:hypothetical protein